MTPERIRKLPVLTSEQRETFFSRTAILGECVVWTGRRNHCKGGDPSYGVFDYSGGGYLAHRVSWLAHTGEDPGSMGVLHKCDNPPCVKFEHLFLGDDAANALDMVLKNRQSRGGHHADKYRGSAHPLSTLDEQSVLEIRELAHAGVPQKDLANVFGTSRQQVNDIVRGRRWKHVGGPLGRSRVHAFSAGERDWFREFVAWLIRGSLQ